MRKSLLNLLSLLIVTTLLLPYGCTKKESTSPINNTEAILKSIDFEYNGSIFNTSITGNKITLSRALPYGTTKATVKYISFSENCSASKKVGELINVSISSETITIKNASSQKQTTYEIQLATKNYASIVEKYGLLHTSGSKIVDKNNLPVSLAGNSFFWSNDGWDGERYYKSQVVSWLALDWETSIVRAAMGVDEEGGYLQDKIGNINKVKTIVDAAIANGLYVIIDWHSHNAYKYPDDAIDFFTEMATLYGNNNNIIYEIFNEPLDISWPNVLKPYAEKVITAIRKVDPDNLIVVGTPIWSQRVDLAAADPITISENIAYTLHFYTVYHKQDLRDIANAALKMGLPIFVTEWGPIGYTQNDPEAELWMEWCRTNMISHCAWSVSDKVEEWSIVKAETYKLPTWTDLNLTESGKLERKFIRSWTK